MTEKILTSVETWEGSPENGPFKVEGIRHIERPFAVVNKVPEIVNSFVNEGLADAYCNYLNGQFKEAN